MPAVCDANRRPGYRPSWPHATRPAKSPSDPQQDALPLQRRGHSRIRAPEASATGRESAGICGLVRAGSARHRKPLILAGRQRSRPAYKNRRSHGLHRCGLGSSNRMGPGSNPTLQPRTSSMTPGANSLRLPAIVPVIQGSHHRARGLNRQNAGVSPWRWPGIARLYRGCPLAQTPPGLPLARRLPGGFACRGQPAGVCLASARSATRGALLPRSESCLSMFGPHAIGTERSPTVPQRYVVPAGHPCDHGEMSPAQNPDKDEVPRIMAGLRRNHHHGPSFVLLMLAVNGSVRTL
jgi:hypothetical protein